MIQIHCADSYAVLPQIGATPIADVLITDPPYTKQVHDTMAKKGTLTNGVLGKVDPGFEALGDFVESLEFVPRFASLVRRWSLFFCALESLGDYQRASPETWIRSGIYAKGKAMPQITGDRPGNRCEGVAIFHPRGRKFWRGGGTAALWTGYPESRKQTLHPTAKPRFLAMRLIELFTEPGETILDPFAGTGNVAIAAHALGRSYIGIERNPEHAANAKARIESQDYGELTRQYAEFRKRFVEDPSALLLEIIE